MGLSVRNKILALFLLGAAAVAVGRMAATAPDLPKAVAAARRENRPVKADFVAADNRFGFRLFQQLLRKSAGQNVFIAPTSVALALHMTYNGAVGSFDSRLLPAARRFEELKASAVDVHLEPLAEVEVLPRLPRPAGDEGLPDDAN